jgi:hypothetical protein
LFYGRDQPIDRQPAEPEEIQVSGPSIDIAADDKRCAAGQGKVFSFRQTRDDRGDPLLERAQHASSTPRWSRNQPAHA